MTTKVTGHSTEWDAEECIEINTNPKEMVDEVKQQYETSRSKSMHTQYPANMA